VGGVCYSALEVKQRNSESLLVAWRHSLTVQCREEWMTDVGHSPPRHHPGCDLYQIRELLAFPFVPDGVISSGTGTQRVHTTRDARKSVPVLVSIGKHVIHMSLP